jgi:Domain of unknown function (DUF4340)
MKFWRTYVAVAVLAGLGAYIYFVESKREDKPDKNKEKVFKLEKAKVKELELQNAGESVRIVKEGNDWKLTAPTPAPADSGAVDSVLSSLESLEIDEEVTATPTSLKDFGLEQPKQTVKVVQDGAKEPLQLLVGDKLPDSSGVYAKLPTAARVFTLPSFGVSSLEKKPFDFRDRDLLHVKRDDVRTLEVSGPEGGYALIKDDKGEWAFTKPLQTKAGRWSVDGLVGTIEGLRMESVAAEDAKDPKPFGLDKPARTVTLVSKDGATKTLEIGSSAGEKKYNARLAGSGLVAVVPGAIVDDLAKGMKELRAKRLLEVATYETEGFDVEEGAVKKVYAKSKEKDKDGLETSKWKRTAPEAKDLETTKVEDALFKLGGVEVQDFVDAPKAPAAYGLDAPVMKVTLRAGAGKPESWVELGKKDADVYARRSGDTAVLKLDATKSDELLKAFKEI